MKRILYVIGFLILAAIAAYLFFFEDKFTTISGPQSDFVIEDTASIGKIMIANTQGTKAVLERQEDGDWILNDKYLARQDAINTILKTFKLIYVREPVSKSARDQVLRNMSGSHRKVEVYDRQGEWIKTYYIGTNTQDNQGTFMLLETEDGRSSDPYITTMKGFRGTLYTRFITNVREWRSTRAFLYPNLNIKRISVDYPNDPDESFIIEYGGGNDISLISKATDRRVESFDTLLVKDYMLNFKKAYFEVFDPYVSEAKEDSILNSQPYQHISVTDNQGETTEVWLHHMDNTRGKTLNDGTPYPYDPEYLYGTLDRKELARAQRGIWDPFVMPLSRLIEGRTANKPSN